MAPDWRLRRHHAGLAASPDVYAGPRWHGRLDNGNPWGCGLGSLPNNCPSWVGSCYGDSMPLLHILHWPIPGRGCLVLTWLLSCHPAFKTSTSSESTNRRILLLSTPTFILVIRCLGARDVWHLESYRQLAVVHLSILSHISGMSLVLYQIPYPFSSQLS